MPDGFSLFLPLAYLTSLQDGRTTCLRMPCLLPALFACLPAFLAWKDGCRSRWRPGRMARFDGYFLTLVLPEHFLWVPPFALP